ncbi:MAG: sigma-70 family RNA polymerase sigma factor [Bacillota bacterium]
MQKRNDGNTENEILQNQFTAYLLTAVKRQKVNYLRRYEKLQRIEIPLELQDFDLFIQAGADLTEHLPFFEQIENPVLYTALLQARERDRYIFLTRVLDERSFLDLSKELGLSYKATTHLYYRFIAKVKEMMGGEER